MICLAQIQQQLCGGTEGSSTQLCQGSRSNFADPEVSGRNLGDFMESEMDHRGIHPLLHSIYLLALSMN